jgi:hypothetical protein
VFAVPTLITNITIKRDEYNKVFFFCFFARNDIMIAEKGNIIGKRQRKRRAKRQNNV